MPSVEIEIKIDSDSIRDAFERKISEIPEKTGDLIFDILNEVRNEAISEAPVLWGDLKNSHTVNILSAFEGIMYPDVPHALFVIEGTSPHWIGSPVFIKDVGWRYIGEHPGTAPNDYLERAVENADSSIERLTSEFGDWLVE